MWAGRETLNLYAPSPASTRHVARQERVSKSTGRTYFYNKRTGGSTWEWPTARDSASSGSRPVGGGETSYLCVLYMWSRSTVRSHSREYAPAVQLHPLPFAYDALEPRLSRQTMTLHHTKHHAKHVAIINGMIEGTEMEKDSLEVRSAYLAHAVVSDVSARNEAAGREAETLCPCQREISASARALVNRRANMCIHGWSMAQRDNGDLSLGAYHCAGNHAQGLQRR